MRYNWLINIVLYRRLVSHCCKPAACLQALRRFRLRLALGRARDGECSCCCLFLSLPACCSFHTAAFVLVFVLCMPCCSRLSMLSLIVQAMSSSSPRLADNMPRVGES